MTTTDILTIIVLGLNAAALIVLIIQTILTRRTLDIAHKSIDSSRKIRELETLPRANFIITVQYDLHKWKNEFKKTISTLRIVSQQQNSDSLKSIAQKGLKSPKGLIDKYMYEHCPNWLSVIWVTGAQYYYNAKAPQCDFWSETTNKPNFYLIENMIIRYEESIEGITSLLTYVDDIVPKSYLESPASLNDVDFLSD